MKDYFFYKKNSFGDMSTIIKSLIFISLLLLLGKSVIWGRKGFIDYQHVQEEIVAEKDRIRKLKNKIKEINEEIELWQKDNFMVEKTAREDLQMIFPFEKVYFLEKTVK